MFETMMEVFSENRSKAEAKAEVRQFKEWYEDNPKLLQMLSEAFNEMTQHKDTDSVIADISDISSAFGTICNVGNITSNDKQEEVMSALLFMYSQTGY